jgi:DNA-directed RNA polymerase subunit RPC12/RpoP
MPTEVEQFRELARAYWAGQPISCPTHHVPMTGSFVQTTFADHIYLTCSSKGKEAILIPQRPRQMQFHDQMVEGFVENIQRGDAIRCYRCQSKIETNAIENRETGITDYTFTCIRCYSWGRWVGKPELAKIGKD